MKPIKARETLTSTEIAALDMLITVAQRRGVEFSAKVTNTQEQAEAHAEHAVAMWEARHGGIDFSERDRETLRQIGQLAATLESAPTLEQLLTIRAEAVRTQRQG